MDSSILTRHYGKILEDNREKILSGGTGDSFLRNAKEDSRMALVVLIRISPEITRKIGECIGELKEIEPELYYYPKSDLHITVMDILRGEEGRTVPEDLDRYLECIQKCSEEIGPFEIVFDGLVASDNAVMVRCSLVHWRFPFTTGTTRRSRYFQSSNLVENKDGQRFSKRSRNERLGFCPALGLCAGDLAGDPLFFHL